MALWQFDCYIVPKKAVEKDMIIDEGILSWKRYNLSQVNIDFLEKQNSWTENIVQYGKNDETCIEILYENGALEEICCRFDLRSLSKKLLEQIIDYVKKIDGLIFYDNKIFPPNIEDIVELMKCSKANKFCQNPIVYFDEISKNELI